MFNLIIGEKTKEYMRSLGISNFPFGSSELRDAYRRSVKRFHVDAGSEPSEDKMKLVNEAFASLKNLAYSTEREKNLRTLGHKPDDAFDLYQVVKCPRCHGKRAQKRTTWDTCRTCGGDGKARARCKAPGCNGGVYTKPNGDKTNCRVCNGTSIYVSPTRKCPSCKGKGVVRVTEEVECGLCDGLGQVKKPYRPFNPAIPKGAILNKYA